MDRIVGGIDVQDDFGGRHATRTDEEPEQVTIEQLDAFALGMADFEPDGAFFEREFRLAAGEGILKACQTRAAGERPLGVGGDIREDLEEGIGAHGIGIVAVGVAGLKLVDLLGQQGLGGMGAVLERTGVGKEFGQAREHAEAAVEVADGQQPHVGDDAWAVEGDLELLRTGVIQGNMGGVATSMSMSLRTCLSYF